MNDRPPFNLRHWLQDRTLRALIWGLLRLPYRWRVPLCGWVISRIIAPLAGYRKRVRDNLALVMPDLPESEVRRISRAVPDNVGRTVIEIYSGPEFIAQALRHPLTGGGVEALEAAHAAGRPVILVTGHFGNYDASRAALIARGYRVGALYMPMANPYFNAHYVQAISGIGTPLFPRGRSGLADMVRHLRSGGMLGMLVDQHMGHGEELTFFGHEALTALSAAELALKYDALLIPTYAVRKPDGLSFEIIVEPPIAKASPEEMTQGLNNSLEALVRQHLDQWFWIHRRWKGRHRSD
jgi:Kdo2-lipid IVA lauroyltransferase/acyltransferase